MTRFLLFFAICFISFQVFAQTVIHDPNVQVRPIKDFNAIEVSHNIELILTQSGEEQLAVSAGSKQSTDAIKVSVDNGVLRIMPGEGSSDRGNKKVKAYVSVKDITALKLDGAATAKIIDGLSLQQLRLSMSGASDLEGELNIAGRLTVMLNGASDVKLKGAASELWVNSNGASDIKGYDFVAAVCNIDVSGASSVKITAEKEISINASGASSVLYKGNASIKDVKAHGASNISRKM